MRASRQMRWCRNESQSRKRRCSSVSTIRAFSSEVDTGSREENASNKEVEPPFRFNRNGKGSCALANQSRAAQAAKEARAKKPIARLIGGQNQACRFPVSVCVVPVLVFGFTEA